MDFQYNPLHLQFLGFINTPSLSNSKDFLNYPNFETTELDLPEIDAMDLELPENLILGKRVEHLFAHYVRHFTSERILMQGKVICKRRVTIGELDFILQNSLSSEISHLELVFKYYLYDPNFEEEPDRWIGPNRKDTLVKKIEKLKLHQFPLLFREECRESLEPVTGPVDNIEQKICFKANLFVPREILNQSLPLVNNAALRGYWIRQEEFSEEDFGKQLFYSPKKLNWPINPEYCSKWYTYHEIVETIGPLLRQHKSPLIWMNKDCGLVEQFFVVWW